MNSRRSNVSNFQSDTESLNAKDLIYVIRKQSQHSQHSQTNLRPEDNLQVLNNKIKKHSLTTERDFNEDNGAPIWSIGNVQEISQQQAKDLLTTNRVNHQNEFISAKTSDDEFDKNEFSILKPNKLNPDDLEHHRSNQYLNKRLPWYCESSSPINWFKQYSNDQLPKVHYNQKIIEQQQQMNKNEPLINLNTNGYDLNNFDSNSVQTYVKNYPVKENNVKHVKIPTIQQDYLTFVDRPTDTVRYRSGSHNLLDANSKSRSIQNPYEPYKFNFMNAEQQMHASKYQHQWRKLSLPHAHSQSSKFLGSSRSSYSRRRSFTKSKFKFNPFASFYKPHSTNYSGLNEMFADSSVPGVREVFYF